MKNLPKSERLSSKIKINELFNESAQSFVVDGIKVYWMSYNSVYDKTQILISVSKKLFSKSVNRNKIKRYLREAYRSNKSILNLNDKIITIGFVYLSSEILDFKSIERKIKLILHRLNNEI